MPHRRGTPIQSLCDSKSPFYKGGFRGNVNTLHMACSKYLILDSRLKAPLFDMPHEQGKPYATVRVLGLFYE